MPEGDTVFRVTERLRDALAGGTLTRCDIRVPRYATVDLTGRVVDEVLCRGKHTFIRVGPASIHVHLLMDGSWHFGRVRAAPHRVRILLETANSRAAGVDLGVLEILDRRDDLAAVAHLGPDLLSEDWSAESAATAVDNLAADPDRPLAQALLDQRVMAGVGNVYANELCFVSGLRPNSPVDAVSDAPRLVDRAHKMLWLNRSRAIRCTTGDTRRGRELWVYGRAGQPCRRCGTAIESDTTVDRVSYWCPNCQR